MVSVEADIIRPPPDLCRAGGVAEQAAAGSAEGGAVKQSEAALDGVFLSSPILSFARKRKNGKKKKRVPCVGFLSAPEDADAALGPVSFLCLARKILERKNRLCSLKGFWALSPRITARIRSLWRSVAFIRHS